MGKIPIGINVFDAAKERIKYVFDEFSKIYVSCSFGKDSTVMLHMVMDEAIKRNRKVGVLFVDLEAQYKLTINHGIDIINEYYDNIDKYWVCLPLHLRNAVSQFEPQWVCWDLERSNDWVREMPSGAISEIDYFPFFRHAMEFEEFVLQFGKWYGKEQLTACFVGIRSDESLNRYRTIMSKKKQIYEDKQWTTWLGECLYNIYPIYDWKTKDIWIYHAKTGKSYNKLYDRMHQAGLSIHQMRICQPYGDDQRKGLYLYHAIEPETWGRVVARVNGANQGALYAQDSGNILGNMKITKPNGHTWESFSYMILDSMPKNTSEHYKNKIAVFIKWWMDRGYSKIPDFGDAKDESGKKIPSWRRICKALLRNDYWCKGLSFSQHKSNAYDKYKKLMRKRRAEWSII